jgi:hypothetical protein
MEFTKNNDPWTLIEENKLNKNEQMLLIKTLDETSIAIKVTPKETIEMIKAKLEDETGVPSYSQRLIFAGKQFNSRAPDWRIAEKCISCFVIHKFK